MFLFSDEIDTVIQGSIFKLGETDPVEARKATLLGFVTLRYLVNSYFLLIVLTIQIPLTFPMKGNLSPSHNLQCDQKFEEKPEVLQIILNRS